MGPLTAESELLFQIARPSLDEAARQRIRLLAQSVLDWDFLHHLVSRHRLGPLLYVHLNAAAASDAPRPVFMDVWRTYETNRRRNVALAIELARVVRVLEDAGVRTVAYKGPILALQLYDDVALREFEDLDLLVASADLPKAIAILCAERYEPADQLGAAAEAALYRARAQYHRVLVHRETREPIEIHWKTDPHFPIERADDDEWWASRPRLTIGGEQVRTLSANELVVVLGLHGTKHQGHRLGWFVELAHFIRQHREQLDWQEILRTVERLGCRRRVFVSLFLADAWADAPLPDFVRDRIRSDATVVAAANETASRFLTRDIQERQGLDRLRMDLKLCDHMSQRVRVVWDVALAPSKHEFTRYGLPAPLEFLYLPLRLARLAAKYGWRR